MPQTCVVNKIDSNITGLAFAEEACLKILPVLATDGFDPTWFALEPNSYSDFGGDLTTVTRQPISATRQQKKGTVTSLAASGGFNQDVTQTNLQRLLQGFFFANARQKPRTQPFNGTAIAISAVANSDNSFAAASGLTRFIAGQVIKSVGFASNNFVGLITSAVTAKIIVSGPTLVDEAAPPATARLETVGFQFASGQMSLTASAAAVVLALSGLAKATGVLTFTAAGTTLDTVTIGSHVYTLKTALSVPNVADEVLLGVSATATAANLAAAINGVSGAGTQYGSPTVANTQVTAVAATGVLTVTSLLPGISSNSIGTVKTSTAATWGAATLAGGTGSAGFVELGLVEGEWIYVGDDNAANSFTQTASTNRPGYARIATVTDASLTLDDTTWVPQTDAGTGKTIRMYFGTVIRNEPLVQNIVTRSYNLERSLGHDLNGIQSEYLVGAIANEFKLNVPADDKINADLTFIALDDQTRNGTLGLKPGARVAAPGESAFNTSQDLYRIRMAIVDPTTIDKAPLFAYLQTADITIANNAAAVRALGNLGAIDVSVGNFEASGTLTALFSTVDAVAAIRNNADVCLNAICARANGGFIFDMPLLGLGGGRLAVELNKPITLPLTAAGAQNVHGYTLLSNWFSYLPNIAMPS